MPWSAGSPRIEEIETTKNIKMTQNFKLASVAVVWHLVKKTHNSLEEAASVIQVKLP